jgi:hypothetical protein
MSMLLVQAAQLPNSPAKMADDLSEVCLRACDLESCIVDHLKETRERLVTWLEMLGISQIWYKRMHNAAGRVFVGQNTRVAKR